jgi:LysM repeat protein
MLMKRSALTILAASVLAACQTPPKSAPAAAPAEAPASTAPEPAAVAAPIATQQSSGPVSPALQQQAQKVALSAVEMLESGNEEQAKNELKRALAIDPLNKLSLSLQKQIAADPIATLGRDSFSYTVRPSDTMSRISQRYLGDVYSFYILARYNDIKVPKQLSSGQSIRIPGKYRDPAPTAGEAAPRPVAITPSPSPIAAPAPSPVAAPTPAPAPAPVAQQPEATPGEKSMKNAAAAERAGDLVRARTEYLSAANLSQPGAVASADRVRTLLINRYSANARGALARQDLDGSIANWQKVLELDPENGNARLELDRARGLKEKLQNVK